MLDGGAGNDRLEGGLRDDVLTGGVGSDTFVFRGWFGTDRVTDFTDGEDLLDLRGLGLSGLDDLQARQVGDDVQLGIAGGPNSGIAGLVVLENVDLADLNASDFLF